MGVHRRRPPVRDSLEGHATVVVVGAGLAGLRAAERLRESGFPGSLVIVGDEPHKPYNRTPLSKQMLTGALRQEDLRLPVFADLRAVWRTGVAAEGLDVERQAVRLPGGERLRYDGLVLATGVRARHLPGAPTWSDHVWMLRDLRDARAIRRRLVGPARRVVVIGGGFTGTELAATCRRQGLDVSLVHHGPVLLGGALGGRLGAMVTELHRRAGVRLHLGRSVAGWHVADDPRRGRRTPGAPVSLLLDDGGVLDADLVIVAVGSTPAVNWLAGSGLDLADGVLAGPTCHAVAAGRPIPTITVAGDVARWPNLRFDRVPRRFEHWITAAEQGQAAADGLLAGPAGIRPFMPVPRFWTDQFGMQVQGAGIPSLGDRLSLVNGTPQRGSFLAAYTRDGTVVGAVAVNAGRELARYLPAIGRPFGAPPTERSGARTTDPAAIGPCPRGGGNARRHSAEGKVPARHLRDLALAVATTGRTTTSRAKTRG